MLSDELRRIIKEEKDVVPFLKNLTPKEKKTLVPFLRKFREEVFAYKDPVNPWSAASYQHSHTDKQRRLVSIACFACFNKTDAKKTWLIHHAFNEDYLDQVISWYVPSWLKDLINEERPWSLTYEKIMELSDAGILNPSIELIIDKLPNAIIQHQHIDGEHKRQYTPEALLKNEQTLKEHIWLLFENESEINNYYNYLNLENYSDGNDIWIYTIIKLLREKRIEREKVLLSTIYTSTKGFNKRLSGWFCDLLIELAPDETEIIDHQKALFTALNSPHSKIVNHVLKLLKTVASHEKFNHESFIENASVLLNSETKSVVNSTLMLLDKIARINKGLQTTVSKTALEALISTDEKIQNRAAKIILKYGEAENEELEEGISSYIESLFHSSREILKSFDLSVDKMEDFTMEKTDLLADELELPALETNDDLIFFVSQSIDNNEPYHLDVLMSYLPKLSIQFDENNVGKLESLFKRSLELSLSFEWQNRVGQLEKLASVYINDLAKLLLSKYPEFLANYNTFKKKKLNEIRSQHYYREYFQNNLKSLEDRSNDDYIYKIYQSLLIKSKQLITKQLTLDMLSLPTHTPCWIKPEVLVARIITFEKANEPINLYDFQVAIGRIPTVVRPENIASAIENIQDVEIRNVLRYQFDLIKLEECEIKKPDFWLQSIISKNKTADVAYFQALLSNPLRRELNNYDWNCHQIADTYKDWDYATNKYYLKEIIRKTLKIHVFDRHIKERESIASSVINIFRKKKKTVRLQSIYNFLYFQEVGYDIYMNEYDDLKFLYLSPNNPGMFLSWVIHYRLRYSTLYDGAAKKSMVNLLKALYEIWYRKDYNETTYLFLATGFLCNDKVSRELAGEIWIKAVYEDTMNNELLGRVLGKLEAEEYGPLKRFTDLLSASLFNISAKHNTSLMTVLDNMMGEMNDSPIRGIKKLLEIFLELKYTNPQFELSPRVKEKFTVWEMTNSIKSVINKIQN